MKAVVLPAYNNNLIRALLGIKIEDQPIPEPADGEVQIKMEAAPCNPSDIAFLRGGYNIKKNLPCIPGFEGCGVITKTGGGIEKNFIGKRVSCFVQDDGVGTWSEYVVAPITNCIFLKDDMLWEQAACFAVNPFTAYGLYGIAQEEDCKAIIQNAATGQVGRFIRVFAKSNKLNVINIVRKAEQVNQLKSEGGKYVLDSNTEDFPEKLKELSHELNATIAFDAVGGEMTAQLLNAMPADSGVVLYGGLSGNEVSGIDPMGVIFDRKTLFGFTLMDWMESLEEGEFEEISGYLQDLFIEGTLKTEIQGVFSHDEVVNGIRSYIGNMSAGKILIKTK
jgi:NADPH:quinone reductase-like Zn-dependent oxidoreductase